MAKVYLVKWRDVWGEASVCKDAVVLGYANSMKQAQEYVKQQKSIDSNYPSRYYEYFIEEVNPL